jgi:tetratricopeptide (TPR) repeat protein
MIPRAKDLRKLWFEWPESRFGRFNFQRDEQIDALKGLLVDDGPPAVVVLGGEPGIGRGFLCEAVVQRAHEQGHEAAVWHLDLDGFEPDVENPLTRYLRHLIDQEERHIEASRDKARGAVKSAAKTLSKLDLVGQASEMAASLLSLLWQFEDPLNRFVELLGQPPRGSGVPPREDPDTLHRFLAELTRDRKLLIHVSDGPQLTSSLRRWLIREAERAPERLMLVISCLLDQSTAQAAPEARHEPKRFDLHPLTPGELLDLLDRRFDPNEFPNDFVALLMRRCHGRPVAVANQLADLMEAELLVFEEETWRLPPEGLEDVRLVNAFSRGLFEEVDERLAALAEEEPELERVLYDLLSLAALCGRYVPMAVLLEHLHLDEDTAEAAIDWVDDVLVGELGWLTDLGFNVVGLHGHNVYAFTHPLLSRVVLDQESEVDREARAVALLRFLEQRVRVAKRGWARCFLSIAEHLGDRERQPYECLLAWWIGMEAAEALQAEIRAGIEHEEVEPELVWRVARDSKAWPAIRRLAVLEAYAQATVGKGGNAISVVPFDRLSDFHILRADLLIDVGRYGEALDNALKALKLVSRDPVKRAQVLNYSGAARFHLGDASTARSNLEEALALARENLGEERPETLRIMNNLAISLQNLGDLVGARQLEEQVLEVRHRVFGEEHPDTMDAMTSLAVTLHNLGDRAGALQIQKQALEGFLRTLGEDHPRTLTSMSNLAQILGSLGNLLGARQLAEQVLEVRRRVLGEEHPDTMVSINHLGVVLHELGDLQGARQLAEQALEVRRRVLGGEHPGTMKSMYNLACTLHELGERQAARDLMTRVVEVSRRVLGEEHSWTQTSIQRLRQLDEG